MNILQADAGLSEDVSQASTGPHFPGPLPPVSASRNINFNSFDTASVFPQTPPSQVTTSSDTSGKELLNAGLEY